MPPSRPVLRLEALDGRDVPSAVVPPALLVGPASVSAPAHPRHLHGSGGGTYTGDGLVLDAGVRDTLSGSVALRRLGTFDAAGTVGGVGMIPTGRATGSLVLTNAAGSITVELTGPVQPGFSPLPTRFRYTVVEGTGAYTNLRGAGTVALATTPDPAPGGPVVRADPPFVTRGTFTVRFS